MNALDALSAGRLAGARQLKLTCGLTHFPPEIFDLADTLEVLDLSGNALSTLPAALPRLRRLRILFCSGNPFTVLPEVLGACPQLEMIGFKACDIGTVPAAALPPTLRWLILTDNRIAELPASIGRCTRLRKLMLAGNRLAALPPEMAACAELELLRIAANRFEALPDWLLALPRLAWLAFAGNPCSDADEAVCVAGSPVARIAWTDLQVHERLGEGASGVIHRATWQGGGVARAVALKCFKGAMTSDGLPHSEMAACAGAGGHPQLISVLGCVDDHPDGGDGLVMPLIDPALRNLAGPPSLDSCTRDIYPADTRFRPAEVLRIACDIASAVAHLHARGILHGDLYAHNILRGGDGQVLLGDFGAASFFNPDGGWAARALQRIELRAFGVLLDELLAHCEPAIGAALAGLAALRDGCMAGEVAARPSFAEVGRRLRQLADSACGDAR